MTIITSPQNSSVNSPFRERLMMAVVYMTGVPLIKLLDKTGLYLPFARLMAELTRKRRIGDGFGDYQPTSHDVVVCAYPKSGTNWLMQMAYQIAFRGQGDYERVHDVMPWPDALFPIPAQLDDDTVIQASPTGLRVIKTHLDWQYIPYQSAARYICVLRDPKDVFVSSYFFVRDVALGPMMPSIKTWLQTFLTSNNFFLGSWAENLHSYWQIREHENVLLVTFEQMKADQRAIIQQVAAFMGVDLTVEEFNLVDEKSHFRYMKAHATKFDPPKLLPWTANNTKLIRKGDSGGSSELLTVEQQRQIDDFCRAELQRLGCNFPYDEMFVLA